MLESTHIFDPHCEDLIAKMTFTGFAFMVMVGFNPDATGLCINHKRCQDAVPRT